MPIAPMPTATAIANGQDKTINKEKSDKETSGDYMRIGTNSLE